MKNLLKLAFIFLLSVVLFACKDDVKLLDQPNSIRGKITCQNGEPLVGVTIEVSQNGNLIKTIFLTDDNGEYSIPDLVQGNDYSFNFLYKDELLNNQEDVDALKEVIDKNPNISAYTQIAGDINRSGTITAFDYAQLEEKITRGEILNWQIVPTGLDYLKEEQAFLFPNNFSKTLSLINYNGSPIVQDFIGVKRGDVDRSVCN